MLGLISIIDVAFMGKYIIPVLFPIVKTNHHKLPGMINIVSKICGHEGCTIQPSYHKLYSPTYNHCVSHSTLNEYDCRKGIPLCKSLNCQNIAHFIDGQDNNYYPVRCETHKLVSDIRLSEKECQNCEEILYFPDNREHCMQCGNYRERILYHFKEFIIRSFFITNGVNFIYDKRIDGGKYKFRPDFSISCKFGHIIVEIDEFQHKRGYSQNLEINRMSSIFSDLRQSNPICEVLFIRYNHDNSQREKYLHMIITHFANLPNLGIELGIIYLFYNEFDGHPQIKLINSVDNGSYNDEPDFDKYIE